MDINNEVIIQYGKSSLALYETITLPIAYNSYCVVFAVGYNESTGIADGNNAFCHSKTLTSFGISSKGYGTSTACFKHWFTLGC